MRVRLRHQIKHGGARIALIVRFLQIRENQITGPVMGSEGEVLRDCLGRFVQLEAGQDVKSEALAPGVEKAMGFSPAEEIQDRGPVVLALEEQVGSSLRSESGGEGVEVARVASEEGEGFLRQDGGGRRRKRRERAEDFGIEGRHLGSANFFFFFFFFLSGIRGF